MNWRFLAISVIAASAICSSALASTTKVTTETDYRLIHPLPTGIIPDGWGVNIHFTHPEPGEMRLLASEGFTWIRMDFSWSAIEKQKGDYNFSSYDDLLHRLDQYHIRPVFILDYGNDLYQRGAPTTDASRVAFDNFVAASVTHFRHRGVLWEMWNEPNGGFWKPKADVDQYIALATSVGQTIRKVAPDEWFIGPATAFFDWKFLTACFQGGLLQYFDAVTVHPYRGDPPESTINEWARLRGLIAANSPSGKYIPVLSGEWGYSSATGGVSEQKQADYAVRQYLCDLANGAFLSIWYDWRDDGNDAKNIEHRFGTVHRDMNTKPTYDAIRSVSSDLAGYESVILTGQAQNDQKPFTWIEMFVKLGNHQGSAISAENSVFYAWTGDDKARRVDFFGSGPTSINGMPQRFNLDFNSFWAKYKNQVMRIRGN